MKIGIIGYGVVGRNFHRLIERDREELKLRYGIIPQVIAACDRSGYIVNEEGLGYEALSGLKGSGAGFAEAEGGRRGNATDMLSTVDLDVLIETSVASFADGEPAYGFIRSALRKGVHVITTNKPPLALYMPALLEEASYGGAELLYSGTVGGGTPFLSMGTRALRGNRVMKIRGILNGTTNYILSRMLDDGLEMDVALAEAQRMGVAEADPSLDLGGFDSAAKLVILMNHIMNRRITIGELEINGIKGVDRGMAAAARKKGMALKLIARSDPRPSVSVEEVEAASPLNVGGTYNALEIQVEDLGSEYLIGKGAGGPETATAIIRDLVELKDRIMTKAGHI